jgi:hypothetical protein
MRNFYCGPTKLLLQNTTSTSAVLDASSLFGCPDRSLLAYKRAFFFLQTPSLSILLLSLLSELSSVLNSLSFALLLHATMPFIKLLTAMILFAGTLAAPAVEQITNEGKTAVGIPISFTPAATDCMYADPEQLPYQWTRFLEYRPRVRW